MKLPKKVVDHMRQEAITLIHDYSSSFEIGAINDEGEMLEQPLMPLTVLLSEMVSIWAGIAHTVEERPIEQVEELLSSLLKTTLEIGLAAAKKAKKEMAKMPDEEPSDPFSMVEDIIKEAQKNASD